MVRIRTSHTRQTVWVPGLNELILLVIDIEEMYATLKGLLGPGADMIMEEIRRGKTKDEINTDFAGDVQLVDMLFLFLIHNHYISKTPIKTENKSGWEMTVNGIWLLDHFGKNGMEIMRERVCCPDIKDRS